jgi:phage terminase large subunit GpA-like protein
VIDAGNWHDAVLGFCQPRAPRRVMAGKGVAGTRPAIQASASKIRGGRLWLIGVDGLKAQIMARLARGRTIRFSNTLEPSFYDQLTAERRVVRYSRGQPVRRFVRKPGARAEALDCVVYAFAARSGVQIMLDQREAELHSATAPASAPTVIRSRWMDGG